jgi:flagellar hook-basal body complex protein FliE
LRAVVDLVIDSTFTGMNSNFKSRLQAHCIKLIKQKIVALESALVDARESQKSDTKSSAGDKYETFREMMNQEIEKLQQQLQQQKTIQAVFTALDLSIKDTVTEGSLLETEKGLFYLSAALGKINFEEKTVVCLSAQSPLGKMFSGKSIGERVLFNGVEYTVEDVV